MWYFMSRWKFVRESAVEKHALNSAKLGFEVAHCGDYKRFAFNRPHRYIRSLNKCDQSFPCDLPVVKLYSPSTFRGRQEVRRSNRRVSRTNSTLNE